MPFIDSKITLPVPAQIRENIKAELGKAVSILNKPERYLMLGFEDNYDLYMAGRKLEKGAFVEVKLFGNAPARAYEKMTGEICRIYGEQLGIPGDKIYVTYSGISDWGWNGGNF